MLTPLTDDDPIAIGPYRLQNRIGEGGMGTVYLAFTDRQQPVAVKVASAELSEDVEFRRRFQREVRAAQRVRGGAVATVLEADTAADRPWMVTEYVEGISLADAVRRRGPLPERLVRGLAAGLADALVAIHEAGVVHRDLKPSNILLAWDGPKVIDFGIAQLDGNATLTRSGHVVGTLAWMAPEQMRGEQAGPTADIFSWGCCVAYAATGRHPFHADRAEALAFRIQRDAPDLEHLPGYLSDTVVPALEKEPRLRPSAVALLAVLSGQPVRSRSDAHRATETVLERDWTGQLPGAGVQRGPDGHQGQRGRAASASPVPVSPPAPMPRPSPAPEPPPTRRPYPNEISPPAPAWPVPAQPLERHPGDWRSSQLDHRDDQPSSYEEPPRRDSWHSEPPYYSDSPYPDNSYPGPARSGSAGAGTPYADPAYSGPERSFARPSHREPPHSPAAHGGGAYPGPTPPPIPRAPGEDWRSARAGSLGVPPPADTFRPSPSPSPSPSMPMLPPGRGESPAPRAWPQPPADRSPGSQPSRQRAAGAELERYPAGVVAAAVSPRPGPSTGRPAGSRRASRRPASPRWNLPAVFSAVFAVLWLFGAGSVAGIYLGYRARAVTRSGPLRGDRLAAVGIVLGWPGLVLAVLFLGYAAGHG
ncbi:protein kinase domain-containing protein [Pseudofrankia asymbiotica]|uniref:non-specific serine/threonine protein kinase n=1 Tax=Pseudofrankia asymbiotica TaxID=1834516 RepID=A0A1V2IGE3_9ACTN|nr:protein kinase [Pseudofrankia asymbiotica]ONH32115.1 serine/threonine protein kinase [Pseudofrankia asymbiotica]